MNVLRTLLSFVVFACFLADAEAQVNRHLEAGEFSAARGVAQNFGGDQRDTVLAQIAAAQGSAGETTAASDTIRGIGSASSRHSAMEGATGGEAAAGGSSFADFDSLMELIQTTVVPDTWEALGGPSTMAPYPQGVYVDAHGTVLQCEEFAATDELANLKSLLASRETAAPSDPATWRSPSRMRCVSLKRLLDEWTRSKVAGRPLSESMAHLAGLSRIQYLFIDSTDIVIAGPVGGIENFQGWYRDRTSGLSVLRLDFLATCLASTLRNEPFGCTIDPTTEGLQIAAQVAAHVQSDKIPIGKAAGAMVSALGMQRVEVFGTAGDTPIGYLMVEADRHMKQLALGIEPMPQGAKNYLNVIDATIDQGPPDQLLLRLWFTAKPRSVRADGDRKVFEIAGTPLQLSGQNERAMANGERGNVTRDFRTEAFVSEFNDKWVAIRSKYPVYAALESVYRSASIAELLRRFANETPQQSITQSLAAGSEMSYLMPSPRQVESIAKLHHVRQGRQIHHVLIASGGVAVDAKGTLAMKLTDYPSLDSLSRPSESQPQVIQRWWWDMANGH